MKKTILTLFVALATITCAWGQKVAVKSNLLYDATATVNLGVEVGLAPQWTLDLSGNFNGWNLNENTKMKHWLVQPEVRYWTCEKFNGHFFGLHVHGGEFNTSNIKLPFGMYPGLKENRNQGFYYGAGLGYGYHFILGKRWSLEAELGAGYIGADYDVYRCGECGTKTGSGHENYFGITKLAISVVFLID